MLEKDVSAIFFSSIVFRAFKSGPPQSTANDIIILSKLAKLPKFILSLAQGRGVFTYNFAQIATGRNTNLRPFGVCPRGKNYCNYSRRRRVYLLRNDAVSSAAAAVVQLCVACVVVQTTID